MALDDDLIAKNPFDFPLSSVILKDSKTRVALTPVQEQDFLMFLRDSSKWHAYHDAIFVLLATGLRISEFCALTPPDISFETATLHVTKQLLRYPGMEYALETTKTASGKRDFPLTKDLTDAFKRIIDATPQSDLQGLSADSVSFDVIKKPFFRDRHGMPFTVFHWDKLFSRIMQDYNVVHETPLPHITPHVCRHTFCTKMASAGMNPKVLQYLMGHSDISITLNVYTHLSREDARNELERIQGINTQSLT